MDKLSSELLIVVNEKVAAFGVQDLLNFGMTSKCHRQLPHKKVVLRELNWDCLWYIADPLAGEAKRLFMQRLSRSGHASYSMVLAAFKLHQIRPDL
jgi:hypothetical protein